ncbi:BspA family leucine-rich repeat surface protein [Bifidobacterium sp. ESL0732]|uniref:BspA family leucine-rich repeat surface protein n=1 Tax=Bifidobacterium sp. ESL0732 TaxID=2983222 RepID=UPI0023F6653A|nr:BspA family leucine-rich repeat surface protein [Bifidobacterium sp. ESL0732]WEV64059.1 BspA family leucine-rich repeat surface protein [Bifidobacterium sp. ESL0732]
MRESWPHGKYDNRSLRRGEDGIASNLKHKIGGAAAAIALLSAVSMCVALAPMTSMRASAAEPDASAVASETDDAGQGTQVKSSAKESGGAGSSSAMASGTRHGGTAGPSVAASSAGQTAEAGSSAGTSNANNSGNAAHSTQTAATTKNSGTASDSSRSLTRATCAPTDETTFYDPVGPDGDAHPNHNDKLKGAYWKITSEGSDCVLHIGNNGDQDRWGKIATNDDGDHSLGHQSAHRDFWPWYSQRESITKVVVDNNTYGYKVYTLDSSTLDYMFADMPNLVSADVKNLDVGSPNYMRYMFANDSKLVTVDTTGWRPYYVYDMKHMFDGDNALTSVDGIGGWFTDASRVSDISYMFSLDSSLESMDLSGWATHLNTTVTGDFNMSYMFNMDTDTVDSNGNPQVIAGPTALNDIRLGNWHMGTDLIGMFRGCSKITKVVGMPHWDMSKAKLLDSMFYGCSKLESVNVSDWNTDSATSMSGMFEKDSALTSLPGTQNWTTSSVTNMGGMFGGDTVLTDLNVTGWVMTSLTNTSWMFNSCPALTVITGIGGWHTPALTTTYSMFDGDTALTHLDLSGWHATLTGDDNRMFANCPKLETLTGIDDWDTSAVTAMYSMFQGDSALIDLDLTNWSTAADTNVGSMFQGCKFLDKLSVGANGKFDRGAFYEMGGEVHFLRDRDPNTAGNDVTANGIMTSGTWRRAHATITVKPSTVLHYKTATNDGPNLPATMSHGAHIEYYTRDNGDNLHYAVGPWSAHSADPQYDYTVGWNYGEKAVPSVLTPVLKVAQRTLNGTVWFDTQKNGAIDQNEPRMKKGTRVEVIDGNGNVIAHTTTDENGKWSIGGLPAGTGYRVRIKAGESGIPQAGGFQNTVNGPDFDSASGSFDAHGDWTSASFDMPATQGSNGDGTWSKTENLGIRRGKTTGTPMSPLPVQHKVHVGFNSDGGTSVPGQDLSWVGDGHGEATKPADPTRNGYKFAGWTLHGGDGKTLYDFNTPVTGDIALDALWTKIPSTPAGNQQKDSGSQAASASKSGKLVKTGAAVSTLVVVALAAAVMGLAIVMKKRNQAKRL